jgi:hypothetical protein
VKALNHSLKALSRTIAAVAAIVLPHPASAQDCPTAASGARGFVVERNERQKTEVFHTGQGLVHTVMRYDGETVLETTQYEGLFSLERIDRGRRTTFEPKTELKTLFPLRPGAQLNAKFVSESGGTYGRLYVELDVQKPEDLLIGPCKYSVLRIAWNESTSAVPPQFAFTVLYSPDLKLVLGREYRHGGGRTNVIKFDRIYPVKN